MKKVIVSFVLLALCAGIAQAEWATYIIRNSDGSGGAPVGEAPVIQPSGSATEFITLYGGQKAGWGIDLPAGTTIGDLASISIDRLDDLTRFDAGSGPAVAPYINIWVTDGSGNYAVIANEPSNAEWQPGNQQWDMTWDVLKTKVAVAYENSAATATGGWIDILDVDNSDTLSFAEVAGLMIQAPTIAELDASWTGLGGGAPRELGTNVAYDFNWVFGDTLSHYISGEEEGFVVANPSVTVVPEPATWMMLMLGALSLVGALRLRRK